MTQRKIGQKRTYSSEFPGRDDVLRWEVLQVSKDQRIQAKLISANAIHQQGVRFGVDAGRGYIEFNGQRSKDFSIWWTSKPYEVIFKCHSVTGLMSLYNAYIDDRGMPSSLMYKTGMLVKEQGEKRTYYCNDCNDGDIRFDKLIFSVEKI
jgi:hypothetical protein